MIRLLTFLALVASASATGTCKVGNNGQCSSFDGQNIKSAFPSNCYIPLATGACGSDSWLIFLNTFTMTFNVRYEGFIYTVANGTTFSRAEFSVAVTAAGSVATITATTVPSNTCGLCNNNGKPECLSPITTTPLPTTTEVVTTPVPTTSAPPSTCTVFTSGQCSDFNGCSSTTIFPNNTNIPLAMGACEGETWVVFYSTITMSFSIRYEGFIYPCHAGNKTTYGSVSVEVNIEMTMAVILVDDLPSGLNCGLCSSTENVECESTALPPSESPIITTEEATTTEEVTTAVSTSEPSTKLPPSTCVVSKDGECTGFNGCKSTTTFPNNTEIVLARGDCESDDTWFVFFSTITMTFNIKYEGFIYPCNAGNKTVFGSVSVEINIEMTVAIILVDDNTSGISCGICGDSEGVECSSTSDAPAITEEPTITEEASTSVATTESSTDIPPSTCIISTGGDCTGFNGCKSTTTFPNNTEIVLARGDCDSEDTWIVFYSSITMSFNIKFEGFIHTCGAGNKTTFGSVSVEVNIDVTMAIILVDNLPSGISCGLCGSDTVECSSTSVEALTSTEESTTTEEPTTSVATSEASTELPPSTCIVSKVGECTGFNGCSSTTTFPPNSEIVLARGDCESDDTWFVFFSTITMTFNIKFEGFIYPCHAGNKTTFGSVSVEVNIEVTMAVILVADMPTGIDCGLCGSETVECSSATPALTSTEEPISTSSVATTEEGDCGCPGFCTITTSGDAISFDGSEFNGDFPDDCIVPLASSDCGDVKKWQILLSKATSSFFLVVDGEIIVLGFGSIHVKYEMTVFVTYQTVFIVLPNKSVENDCSVCGKPEYKECIDFPGLPSTPYPLSKELIEVISFSSNTGLESFLQYPLYIINTIDYLWPQFSIARFTLWTVVLSHMSCALNPLIYAYGMPGFKKALRQFFNIHSPNTNTCAGYSCYLRSTTERKTRSLSVRAQPMPSVHQSLRTRKISAPTPMGMRSLPQHRRQTLDTILAIKEESVEKSDK